MQQHTPTGSISDRDGWEWNRVYGDRPEPDSSHPRTFAPGRYDPDRQSGADQGDPDRSVTHLRSELRRRERHNDEIVRQYERRLEEKNRQLENRSGGKSSDILVTILDRLFP